MKVDNILFGCAYYLEYMPYDRLEKDLEMIKAAGMNVIRIAESTWSTWEKHDGVFDFTLLDRMLDGAEKYGLSVIVGTPTYAIPAWLCKKYPDVIALTKGGQGIYGHRQNMDITHPGYLFHAERIIRKMMEHIKDRPCIIGYQLDNETKSYDTYSQYAQAKFKEYLKKNWTSIEEFNLEFGLNYWSNRIDDWEYLPDIRGTINASLGAEYEKFLRKLVTDFFAWQADIVREYSKPDQFITHNFDFEWRNFSFGYQPLVNQPEAAACMDVAGVDIYHPSQDALTGAEIDCGGAIGRFIKNADNYFVLETQSQGQTHWLPYEKQLRLQAFSHIGSGANSILYWNWHSIHNSFETYWCGVLSHDLEENESYREIQTIGKDLQLIGSRIKNLKKTANVAIMLSNDSLTGLDWFPISETLNYNDIMRWIRDVFYRMNMECDFISPAAKNLEHYQLIVLPALYSASEELLHRIDAYVKNGGNILATFKTAVSDEYIKVYHDRQPHILHDCFGISYQQFTVPANMSLTLDKALCDNKQTEQNFSVDEWMELLQVNTASVWASYSHPQWNKYAAVTHNSYGEGSATYIGCHTDKESICMIIRHLSSVIGMDIPKIAFPVIHKSGENDFGKTVHYFYNYSNEKQQFTYPYKKGSNLLSKEDKLPNSTLSLEPWDFMIIEED